MNHLFIYSLSAIIFRFYLTLFGIFVKQLLVNLLQLTFLSSILFGCSNRKNKGEFKLLNFVCNLYRSSIWVCRTWNKRGENVNLICTFKRLVKNRLELEYQCHSRFNDPSATEFFKDFWH